MATKSKRRRLPEEDLEASIQDILQSPITKVNLSFLRPEPVTAVGVDPDPMGVGAASEELDRLTPAGSSLNPMGSESIPMGRGEGSSGVSEQETERTLWRAEHLGAFFEGSRVRNIERAEDALSAPEQRVYDMLWNGGAEGGALYRLVHCSLQRISTELKLNIKTVREMLPRLVEKGFIAVEREADVRRNIATLYRVWSKDAVLAAQAGQDRRWVVRTGRGVFYVHRTKVSVTAG